MTNLRVTAAQKASRYRSLAKVSSWPTADIPSLTGNTRNLPAVATRRSKHHPNGRATLPILPHRRISPLLGQTRLLAWPTILVGSRQSPRPNC